MNGRMNDLSNGMDPRGGGPACLKTFPVAEWHSQLTIWRRWRLPLPVISNDVLGRIGVTGVDSE